MRIPFLPTRILLLARRGLLGLTVGTTTGLAKPIETACPNCIQVSKILFREPIGIFNSEIRFLGLP